MQAVWRSLSSPSPPTPLPRWERGEPPHPKPAP